MDDNMFNMKIDLCEALGLDPNKVTGLSVYVPRLGPPMVEASLHARGRWAGQGDRGVQALQDASGGRGRRSGGLGDSMNEAPNTDSGPIETFDVILGGVVGGVVRLDGRLLVDLDMPDGRVIRLHVLGAWRIQNDGYGPR